MLRGVVHEFTFAALNLVGADVLGSVLVEQAGVRVVLAFAGALSQGIMHQVRT